VTERRGIPLALLPFAAALLAFGVARFATREGHASVDVYEQGVAAIGALAVVVLALATRPAWPLSIEIALTAFSGHWDDMGIPVTVDRLLIATGIVSLLVRERQKDRYALHTRPVDWLLMLAAIYAVFSAVLAGTLDEHIVRYALLDRFSLLGFVLFFVAPKAFRETRDRQVLLGTLVALGAYLGGHGAVREDRLAVARLPDVHQRHHRGHPLRPRARAVHRVRGHGPRARSGAA
jgi:hypothetical protein